MQLETVYKIAAIGISVAVINQLLVKSGKEEYAMAVTVAGLVIAMSMLLGEITALLDYLRSVFEF